jgi:hypothetical protein
VQRESWWTQACGSGRSSSTAASNVLLLTTADASVCSCAVCYACCWVGLGFLWSMHHNDGKHAVGYHWQEMLASCRHTQTDLAIQQCTPQQHVMCSLM